MFPAKLAAALCFSVVFSFVSTTEMSGDAMPSTTIIKCADCPTCQCSPGGYPLYPPPPPSQTVGSPPPPPPPPQQSSSQAKCPPGQSSQCCPTLQYPTPPGQFPPYPTPPGAYGGGYVPYPYNDQNNSASKTPLSILLSVLVTLVLLLLSSI